MAIISNGRIYLNPNPTYSKILTNPLFPVPGNGIRVYTGFEKIVGLVLLIFKKSSFIEIEGKSYLINRNSLNQFFLRRFTIIDSETQKNTIVCANNNGRYLAYILDWPRKMQQAYEKNKTQGYTETENHVLDVIKARTQDITELTSERETHGMICFCLPSNGSNPNSTALAFSIII